MNLFLRIAAVSLTLGLGSGMAWASDTYRVLVEGSSVVFEGKSTIHDFTGTAKVKAGAFRLDAGRVAGFVEVDATSMDTKEPERDTQMQRDHMESAKFPLIRFDLRRFTRGDQGGVAFGAWTMHGVTRALSLPVTMSAGEKPRLSASFAIDMRSWNITPPSKALVINVDPMITVRLDLALIVDENAEIPKPVHHDLAGLTLSDHLGEPHDLGKETPTRLAMIFDIESRGTAKEWDDRLSAELPTAQPLLRILDGSAIKESDRPRLIEKIKKALDGTQVRFLMDWNGEARKRLGITAPVMVEAFAADGAVEGGVDGTANAANLTAALALIGVVPNPPLKDTVAPGSRPHSR